MMQCFVPFCGNTSGNVSTSGEHRITFHELPSEVHLRAAWLRALGKQDNHLPDPAVVCSQHFIDDDFCDAESCARQLRSDAIPSTLLMCVVCLDTDSKLLLMSEHKLEEAYEQFTGLQLFQLCRRANLKQTLCVLCAQRLKNFSRFRDLSFRVHSVMTYLVEQHLAITKQHIGTMYHATRQLKCSFTRTTLGAEHCDLYIDHTDEEEQPAEESVEADVAAVAVKDEHSFDSKSHFDNEDPYNEEYSDLSIKLAAKLDETLTRTAADSCSAVIKNEAHTPIKCEVPTLQCTLCFEEFVQENAYNEHMSLHLQNAVCDASQECKPRAAELELENKTGVQKLNDVPPPSADSTQTSVAPLSARLATNKKNRVQATEGTADTQKSEQILKTDIVELGNLSSQSGSTLYTDTSRLTNYEVLSDDKPLLRILPHKKCYVCDICSYRSTRKYNLSLHIRKHTGKNPYSGDIRKFKRAVKNKLSKNSTDKKPYLCDICSHTFVNKRNLLHHMRTHTGEKPYSCQICNHEFAKKCTLLGHMRTHTGEKPFSCGICNYKFARNYHLLEHMKTHSGEKPFSCQICNRKFARKAALSLHTRTHTGEKPYSCNMCNYKCADSSHYSRHLRAHIGEKAYSCDICTKQFLNKRNLLHHMRTHTDEKPYSCSVCNYKCAKKSSLLRHVKNHR
ncbi:zinc finger protein 37 homolog isoform X3 [Bicyclus anynana]|uniref:Zinc finger protein 37 homolog isoform X3 n=1 Tax=Bicyclus anynana TaxID=110368 RepID=A0ABM3M3V5_BICAN|nr:zinc finger protein 37 homolog isoform X3 [Bicyclus anynana]